MYMLCIDTVLLLNITWLAITSSQESHPSSNALDNFEIDTKFCPALVTSQQS
jgi:hypothetical protein